MTAAEPATLTVDDLRRPARCVVRRVALAQLETIRRASDAYGRAQPRALHDVRVALRRLRTWLRAYHGEIDDTVRTRIIRKIHRVQTATNAERDLEVQYQWLRAHVARPSEASGGGGHRALRRLRRRHRDAHGDATIEITRRLPPLMAALTSALSWYPVRVDLGGAIVTPTMAHAAANALASAARDLDARFARVAGPDDAHRVHAARIAAKRVRYLIEPLVETRLVPPGAIERLTALQDGMGELHDAETMRARFRTLPGGNRVLARARARVAHAHARYVALDAAALITHALADVAELVAALQRLAPARREPPRQSPAEQRERELRHDE